MTLVLSAIRLRQHATIATIVKRIFSVRNRNSVIATTRSNDGNDADALRMDKSPAAARLPKGN